MGYVEANEANAEVHSLERGSFFLNRMHDVLGIIQSWVKWTPLKSDSKQSGQGGCIRWSSSLQEWVWESGAQWEVAWVWEFGPAIDVVGAIGREGSLCLPFAFRIFNLFGALESVENHWVHAGRWCWREDFWFGNLMVIKKRAFVGAPDDP